MNFVLALDQSTSATKAVLFDTQGVVLDSATREHRQVYPQPGWVEHDAAEIWFNVLAVIRDLAARHPERLRRLTCLSLANQRETFVVFDRRTGQPLYNAVVWQCRRGAELCRELVQGGHEPLVRGKTGLKIDTYFSASKLQWLIQSQPSLAARLRAGDALIGTIDTYLIYRLTGGRVFATDSTNASRTLLYDISHLQWADDLCGLFGVPRQALPEVRESFAHFGETDADRLLPHPVPIQGVMGDSQAALFAQRCFQSGMAKATYGSGTSILLNIGHQFRLSDGGAVTALAWVWQTQPTYAFEGLINYSAATVSWLKDQLGLIGDAAETEALGGAVPDNGGVYLVPAFAGLGAPWWRPDARAALLGLTAHTRKEHVVRAALEAIAYQIRAVLEMMRADAGVKVAALHADGGPTRNAFLMQFSADLAGVELRVGDVPEASALGAALAGLLGLGIHRSLPEVAALRRETRSYKPQMDPEAARRLYEGWLAAVRRIL